TDPVAMGLVASLNRPGGNATGVSFQNAELVAKRLGMLRELSPGADRFVALVNPNTAVIDEELHASALALGLSIEILRAGTGREIDAAFANLVQKPGVALSVGPDAVFTSRRAQIVTLAARHAIPAIYYAREFAEIGGLMSYGPNLADVYRQTLCGPRPQRRESGRPTGRAANQIRTGRQPQHRQGARHCHSEHAARARRRGD